LTAVVVLSWLYLVRSAGSMSAGDMADMAGMADMVMPRAAGWSPVDVALLFVMWAVMMVAMMTPSAAPMVLTFVTVNRRRSDSGRPAVSTSAFLLGYLAVWTAFSAVATAAQWWMHETAALSSGMALISPTSGGVVLLAAGIFQWTPLKQVCLSHCRSPLSFIMAEWREGAWGAWHMGLRHGAYCLGCCWVLMALLFVVGVMNLLWVAAIGAFVLVEKVVPHGEVVSRVGGVALFVAGAWMLV
jgi:predicted metal-binding membrane protein